MIEQREGYCWFPLFCFFFFFPHSFSGTKQEGYSGVFQREEIQIPQSKTRLDTLGEKVEGREDVCICVRERDTENCHGGERNRERKED